MLRYFLALFCLVFSAPAFADLQVNISGYENDGAKLGWQYVLPDEANLRYFISKGIKTIRLPMNWKRLQPAINGPLDEGKLAELATFLDLTQRLGVKVIADLHGYARYGPRVLGSKQLPTAALGSFWGQFAKRFAGRFAGYDLMNEPHDMPYSTAWAESAQAAVWQIRNWDIYVRIYVEGSNWSGSRQWRTANEALSIYDPSNRIIYSAHIYFDTDGSGTYKLPTDLDAAAIVTPAMRLAPFVAWCREKRVRCHIGEFGVPTLDARWLPVLDGFMAAAAQSADVLTGSAYFTAGPWMENYKLTLQPAKDGNWTDRPQMAILTKKR